MAFKSGRRLVEGEAVWIGAVAYRVDRVGPGSATVEPIVKRTSRFTTSDGREVTFDAPAHRMTISPTSEVKRVDPAEVEAMTKSKETTKKQKDPKPTKEKKEKAQKEEGLMTFAFRLTPAESVAIHRAAGPGGASKFARAVLAAACAGNMDAILVACESAKQKS